MHICRECHREAVKGNGYLQKTGKRINTKDPVVREINRQILILERKKKKYIRLSKKLPNSWVKVLIETI